MARRRKNDDFEFAELIAKLGGLLILVLFLVVGPKNFSAALQSIVALVICGALLVGVVILAIFVIRKMLRSRNDEVEFVSDEQESQDQTFRVTLPRIEQSTPQPYSKTDFLNQLRNIDWFQFEKLVALAYEYQGFAVTRRGGANPDGGIDLAIEKDGQRSAVQCKQWKTWNVGVKPVREFLGAMAAEKFQHGIFITLNGYYGDAKKLAESNNIEIINETGLAEMLSSLNLHEDPRALEILNDTRKFCPKCERLMVERVAEKGPNPGQRFWGCTGYPKCRFTMPI